MNDFTRASLPVPYNLTIWHFLQNLNLLLLDVNMYCTCAAAEELAGVFGLLFYIF